MNNANLLSKFQFIFSTNDFTNFKVLLHPHGRFFGKMNSEKACEYFHTIFLVKMEQGRNLMFKDCMALVWMRSPVKQS